MIIKKIKEFFLKILYKEDYAFGKMMIEGNKNDLVSREEVFKEMDRIINE